MDHTRKVNFFASLLPFGTGKKELDMVTEQAIKYLEYADLAEFKDLRAENLPYGKQRELEICRAIATGADLLLLDEPAAGLNPSETTQLMDILRKIKSELKKSIFLIEHDMKFVMNSCNRILVLNFGEKIAEGNPNEIKSDKVVNEAYFGKGVIAGEAIK